MDYAVPWNDFGKYDLVILSREGREYVTYYKERDVNPPNKGQTRWLTPAQEQKFEDYVNAGGRLFLYHDGFGAYPKGNGVSRVARAYFIRHPAIVNINVTPTGKMPELTEGVTPFTVADEEYEVEMDESQTSVFMESRSPEQGRAAQGWAHAHGKGKQRRYLVPLFQRGFVWQRAAQWEPLWQDIIHQTTALRTNGKHPNQYHFLGAIVLN